MAQSMDGPPDTEGMTRGDTHEEFAESTVDDREIQRNNFGAGVYRNSELYEQTDRFKRTINANAGIGEDIRKRAKGEAWLRLGRKGWTIRANDTLNRFPSYEEAFDIEEYANFAEEAKAKSDDKRDEELTYGRLVWEDMSDLEREYAITELSSLDEPFDPPEFRVAKFFHEGSRSKGGRLMDNVFGRVRKMIQEGPDTGGSGLFGGKS